jgi:hypothetical protein
LRQCWVLCLCVERDEPEFNLCAVIAEAGRVGRTVADFHARFSCCTYSAKREPAPALVLLRGRSSSPERPASMKRWEKLRGAHASGTHSRCAGMLWRTRGKALVSTAPAGKTTIIMVPRLHKALWPGPTWCVCSGEDRLAAGLRSTHTQTVRVRKGHVWCRVASVCSAPLTRWLNPLWEPLLSFIAVATRHPCSCVSSLLGGISKLSNPAWQCHNPIEHALATVLGLFCPAHRWWCGSTWRVVCTASQRPDQHLVYTAQLPIQAVVQIITRCQSRAGSDQSLCCTAVR